MPLTLRARARRRAARAVAAVALAAGVGVAAAPHALADDAVVLRYDSVIELGADGVAQVTLDLDVDLGTEPKRGPYLTYLVKQRFDDTRDRVYRVSDVKASSQTAPDEVHLTEESGWLQIRIGEEDREDVVGRHTYRVTYSVEGLLNTADAFDLPDDQLYLNVIGDRWEIPLEALSVTVRGPADVTAARCYTGADDVCVSAEVEDGAARFTHDALEPGEPWTVAAAFPAGTFGGVEPILQDRWAFSRAFALTPATGGLAAVATVLGLGAVVRHVRRTGRDEEYEGVTPGLVPAPGQGAETGPRGRRPVAVRFTPPEGLRPGVVGTLIDERAETRDVTATLVDLAVRGYLVVRAVDPEDDGDLGDGDDGDDVGAAPAEDWTLERTDHDPDGADLRTFERTLLDGMFADGPRTRLSDPHDEVASTLGQVQSELYDDVTDRGWFRAHPAKARSSWATRGALVLLAGVVGTLVLALLTSWALAGVPLVVVGIAMLVTTGAVPARTAAGSAVQAQAEGFRLYLETAEAEQLRLAEGDDVFSRYLPFAIAFGIAERWSRVVAEAAAAGRPVPEPAWYVGPTAFWAAGGLGQDVTRLTGATDAAMAPTTAGASGSSGFSGGTAGGGVSGGGGGTW